MIRVLIVDDHPIFRRGLTELISATRDMKVAAEVDDGLRALTVAAEQEWDVALLDISLPRLNGIEVLRRFRVLYPARRVLILSQFAESEFSARVIAEGAMGFISK